MIESKEPKCIPFSVICDKVKRIEALTGKPVDLDRLLTDAREYTQSVEAPEELHSAHNSGARWFDR